jgi:hypothetical protein
MTRTTILLAIIAALAILAAQTSARADGVRIDCQGAAYSASCQLYRVGPAPAPTKEDIARSAARDAAWVDRCKPVIGIDAEGIHRYSYAAPNCEHGD